MRGVRTQENQLQSFQTIFPGGEDGEDEELVGGGPVACDEAEETVVMSCGIHKWRPPWLQRCYNNKMALVLLSYFAFLQGFVVNGLNNVNTTSYERRFQFSSTEVGLISSAYDFAAGLAVVIPSYFGSNGHKPRWLATAAFLFALGSFTMTLPKLLAGPYVPATTSEEAALCHPNGTFCGTQDSELSKTTQFRFFGNNYDFPSTYKYLGLLILGQGFHGLGGSILYSLGTVFIDDNVPQASSPLYISIFYAFAAVGPACGYVVGGEFLKFYVDFPTVDPDRIMIGNTTLSTSLAEENAAWVGAWWLGFSVASALFLSVAAAFLCFDLELPEAKIVRQTRVHEGHFTASSGTFRTTSKYNLWQLPRHTARLLRNPVFVFMSISGAMEGAVLSGFATFLPKFIQNRFSKSAFIAAVLTGCVVVPAGALAQFFSGFISRRLKLRVRGQLILIIISLVFSIGFSACFMIDCDRAPVIGVDEPYTKLEADDSTSHLYTKEANQQSKSPSDEDPAPVDPLDATCNQGCGCSKQAYRPVCVSGRNQFQFFSACHAGCQTTDKRDGSTFYSNCSCLPANLSSTSFFAPKIEGGSQDIADGLCQRTCPEIYYFLVLFFSVVFFTFFVQVPLQTITLRSTSDRDRPFAIGLQWILVRFLGTVPGPIVFGSVIDKSCVVWQDPPCGFDPNVNTNPGSSSISISGRIGGVSQACWLYNARSTSVYLMMVGVVIHFVSLMANVGALIAYRPPPGVDVTDPLSRAVARLCRCGACRMHSTSENGEGDANGQPSNNVNSSTGRRSSTKKDDDDDAQSCHSRKSNGVSVEMTAPILENDANQPSTSDHLDRTGSLRSSQAGNYSRLHASIADVDADFDEVEGEQDWPAQPMSKGPPSSRRNASTLPSGVTSADITASTSGNRRTAVSAPSTPCDTMHLPPGTVVRGSNPGSNPVIVAVGKSLSFLQRRTAESDSTS